MSDFYLRAFNVLFHINKRLVLMGPYNISAGGYYEFFLGDEESCKLVKAAFDKSQGDNATFSVEKRAEGAWPAYKVVWWRNINMEVQELNLIADAAANISEELSALKPLATRDYGGRGGWSGRA